MKVNIKNIVFDKVNEIEKTMKRIEKNNSLSSSEKKVYKFLLSRSRFNYLNLLHQHCECTEKIYLL